VLWGILLIGAGIVDICVGVALFAAAVAVWRRIKRSF
jgi:hypothetical protein